MTRDPGRLLGIDLGDARIGIALSDPLGVIAQPLVTLSSIGPRRDAQRIEALVDEHAVRTVIVGLPLLLSGEEGERSLAAREFAARLERRFHRVDVVLWDERMSTVEAEQAMIAGNMRRKKRRQSIDSMAAAIILQGYLDAAPSASSGA